MSGGAVPSPPMADEPATIAPARVPLGGSRRSGQPWTDAPRPVESATLGPGNNWPAATLETFCEELIRSGGNVSRAAAEVGLHKASLYALRERDPDFAERWDRAVMIGDYALIDEARRRAFEGWDEPVFYKGVLAERRVEDPETGAFLRYEPASVRKFDSRLLELMLRARFPQTFRDRSDVKHSGEVAIPSTVDLSRLSRDELLELQRLHAKARGDDAIDVTPVRGKLEAGNPVRVTVDGDSETLITIFA